MSAVIEANERISCVHIEGLVRFPSWLTDPPHSFASIRGSCGDNNSSNISSLSIYQALLKIAKHCHESLPHMVTGSLLGLAVGDGVLEVTHAFPFPDPRMEGKAAAAANDADSDDGNFEGHTFQIEMMRMLREVNVDNNCVGWYQSMYLGIYSTSSVLENQLSYQTDLSPNAVVLLYDPMQTSHGNLVLKCFRLSDDCVKLKTEGLNTFVDPKSIFEEIPVKLTNPGLARALLADLDVESRTENLDTTFDRLDLSTNPYLEKHLEYLCGWVDELASEQHKFQYYARQLNRDKGKFKDKRKEEGDRAGWASSDAPRRMESLLIANQIRSYCDQMDQFTSGGLTKLYVANGMHKDEK